MAAKSGPWELYDLRSDRAEFHNLIWERPEKAKELEDLWSGQLASMSRLAAKTATQTNRMKPSQNP